MRKVFTFIFTLPFFTFSIAQEAIPCYSDEITYQLVQEHPHLLPTFEKKRQELDIFTRKFEQFQAKADNYIIPIVFHVIHLGGEENISDEQIYDAVKHLNEQFNKRNADTSATIQEFKGIAADMKMEFRLAKIDPDGNCTNGITRHYSPTSAAGDHSVKSVVHWPRDKYVNIYISRSASQGLAGHALMPPVADTLPEWDGIVMSHNYIGTIGTSDWMRRTVLTHEMGHFFNLYHIWGGNNVPGFYYLPVASAGNCDHDDEVEDTPNTIGWQTCNLSGGSCGTTDNVQNFMDYSYCSTMFTEGQKQRVHAALNSPIAQRNKLWTTENLIATGVIDEQDLCFADFELERPYACIGDTVTIYDRSYHNVKTRTWTVSEGTIVAQEENVLRVVFEQEGKVSISLTVSDGTTTETVSKEDILEILPSVTANTYIWEDFENESASIRPVLLNSSNNWQFSDNGVANSKGYVAENYGNNAASYSFDLRPINLKNVNNPSIIFDRAFARISGSEAEMLEIKASNDCGVTWSTFRSFTSTSLKTVSQDTENEAYVPQQDEWQAINSFTIPAGYRKEHTLLRFSFKGKGYNNLYLDNINVGAQNELKATSVNDVTFAIHPNPAQDKVTIQNNFDGPFSIAIYDVLGKKIQDYPISATNKTIHVGNLNNGVYLLKVKVNNQELTKRLIIKK